MWDSRTDTLVVPTAVAVTEGGTQTFEVSLSGAPTSDVTVAISGYAGTDLTPTPPSLTFTPSDWYQAQTVTLTASEDSDLANDRETLTLMASGGGYAGVTAGITVTITDNDVANLVVPASVTVPEGGNAGVDVALKSAPTSDVTVTISGYAGTDLAGTPPSPLSLTFTPVNYGAAQTVTLTASEDNDFQDDTETLTLMASGGGYAGVTAGITVTITDNDVADLVVPASVTVPEGGNAGVDVALKSAPTSDVTVTISGYAGTDLAGTPPSPLSLTFTPVNYGTAQTVTLTASEDNDFQNDRETLTLTASGGGYAGVTADIAVTITDNDVAGLVLSITDTQVTEASGMAELQVKLSRPSEEAVRVSYRTIDVTAEAGADYTASRGVIFFEQNATSGVLSVKIAEDGIVEGEETFEVALSDARNADISRATGTVTILENESEAYIGVGDEVGLEEEGWISFRVYLSRPSARPVSVRYRTEDGTAEAGTDYVAQAGVLTFVPGTVEQEISVELIQDGLDWREETFSVHLESSTHARIGKAVAIATIREGTTAASGVLAAYTPRFIRTSSVHVVEALGERMQLQGSACSAGSRADQARLWHSVSSWDPSPGELLAGCRVSKRIESSRGSLSVWGRGSFRRFNGQGADALSLRGDVTTGMLGMDYRWRGDWLTGVLLAHSRGTGSFEVYEESGEVRAGLTGIYPYVSYQSGDWSVWMTGGYGRGEAEVQDLVEDRLSSRFGAAGVRGTLTSVAFIGLKYHGDVLVADAVLKEQAVTAEVYRIRAGVEADARISELIRPYVEANVRQDGGSAEEGVGLELGAGIRVRYPAWRLKGELRSQGLVVHTAEGFTEWGGRRIAGVGGCSGIQACSASIVGINPGQVYYASADHYGGGVCGSRDSSYGDGVGVRGCGRRGVGAVCDGHDQASRRDDVPSGWRVLFAGSVYRVDVRRRAYARSRTG